MIKILAELPIILTKDQAWCKPDRHRVAKEGAIILLPEDAILVKPRKEKK